MRVPRSVIPDTLEKVYKKINYIDRKSNYIPVTLT